ncbi:MAG: hypothetical protein HN505_14070 [Verrucomicrobia bacterium]|nr:hypothetical protein [Verrucomicrobiota bacterium]MBT5061883.1 hypothetical protein [Verrucomicrobiota bacterium]MBT5477648.1 hypothetical protein [Verrucomicrobiota bacterium]MBT6237338.1 hypothetical protein [Verrucomicrobiota bacterium]MBT7534284.1 hypothetical protein [Verrucomicrobiota bacterium]
MIGLALFFGGKYALDYAMEQFADENPTAFSESTLSPEESATLEKKFNSFFSGQGGDLSLAMNSDEINHLIVNQPEFSDIRDKVRFTIMGSQMKAQLSLPMDDFKKMYPDVPQGMLQGKYINTDAVIEFRSLGKSVGAYVKSMTIKNKQVPASLLSNIQDRNLLEAGPLANRFKNMEDIKIQNGNIIFTKPGSNTR